MSWPEIAVEEVGRANVAGEGRDQGVDNAGVFPRMATLAGLALHRRKLPDLFR